MIRYGIYAAFAAAAAASAADAGVTTLLYNDVEQGMRRGFGFSVMHAPTNDHGGGDILYRMSSVEFVVEYDDMASTLTFTSMQGSLYEETNLNPNLGPLVGSLALAGSSTLNLQASPDTGSDPLGGAGGLFIGGTLSLEMTLFGGDGVLGGGDDSTRAFDLRFLPRHYNELANRFNPGDDFAIGLWGATPEVFGGQIGPDSLGFDFHARSPIIPLPTSAALGAAGLAALASRRRRAA